MPRYRKTWVKTVDSYDMHALPDDTARLMWMCLPLIVDREGRGIYSPAWVRSKVFPLRNDITLEQVSAYLTAMQSLDMITVYEVEGRQYFYITNWFYYQGDTAKEAPSVLPSPKFPSLQGGVGVGQEGVGNDDEKDQEEKSDGSAEAGEWLPEFSEPTPDPLKSNSGVAPEQVTRKSAPYTLTDTLTDTTTTTTTINTLPGNGADHAFLEKVTLLFSEKFPNQPSVLRTLDLRDKYGPEKVMEALTWYAERDISLADALLRARRALPTWRSGKTSKPHPKKTVQPSPEELLAELEGVPHA